MRGELSEVLDDQLAMINASHSCYAGSSTPLPLFAEIRTALEAYANGVNAYIASRTDRDLPPEFLILQYKPRPWVPADSLAVGKLIYEVLSTTYQYDLLRASLAQLPKAKRDMLLPVKSSLDVLVVGKDRAKPTRATSAPSLRLRPHRSGEASARIETQNLFDYAHLGRNFPHSKQIR